MDALNKLWLTEKINKAIDKMEGDGFCDDCIYGDNLFKKSNYFCRDCGMANLGIDDIP